MDKYPEYVDNKTLGEILSISPKTISNRSHQLLGRTKIGHLVRYHVPTILHALRSNRDIFKKK